MPKHMKKEHGEPASTAPETPAVEPAQEKAKPMETVALEEYQALQAELEKTRQQSQEYFDGWQRERADFSNYKRRVDREQEQLKQMLSAGVIKKFLVVLDDLERAMKNRPADGEGAAWAGGVELINRKLQNILDAEGVQRIPAETQTFDPNFHEAISHEDNPDFQSGEIIEVVQQGYLIGDRVLRPALVRVAR